MIAPSTFFGGSRSLPTMSTDVELVSGSKRVQMLTPQFAGLDVYLPPATALHLGGPHFVILNLSGSYSVTVKDGAAGAVVTLTAGKAVVLHLAANTDAAGQWAAHVLDVA